MKIIANVICLDSAPEIPAMLESLKGNVDALVAVDGGSVDETVAIIEKWGAETGIQTTVLKRKWEDDFGLQRNNALWWTRAAMCGEDGDVWILMIDTDDVLTAFDRPLLEKGASELGKDGKPVNGIMCRMDNGNGFFHFCQFFRLLPDSVWNAPIHEHVSVAGHIGMPPAGSLAIKRGRAARHDRDQLRNVRIGRRYVEAEPENSRARFYLARDVLECPVVPLRQRTAEAEGHLRKYLTMETNYITQDRYALLLLARIMCDDGRVEEAREILVKWLDKDPDNRSAYEALSRITPPKEAGVWNRLAASACGTCVLPYASKLPKAVQGCVAQNTPLVAK